MSKLASQFKRSQFCFELNPVVVVEADVIVDQTLGFIKGTKFRAVNTLCLQNREEIFSRSIVIWVSTS